VCSLLDEHSFKPSPILLVAMDSTCKLRHCNKVFKNFATTILIISPFLDLAQVSLHLPFHIPLHSTLWIWRLTFTDRTEGITQILFAFPLLFFHDSLSGGSGQQKSWAKD
jgi:hypothetical protein